MPNHTPDAEKKTRKPRSPSAPRPHIAPFTPGDEPQAVSWPKLQRDLKPLGLNSRQVAAVHAVLCLRLTYASAAEALGETANYVRLTYLSVTGRLGGRNYTHPGPRKPVLVVENVPVDILDALADHVATCAANWKAAPKTVKALAQFRPPYLWATLSPAEKQVFIDQAGGVWE